ncbi:hypothetical protein ACP70R_007796 [Stipagrostis hirtigluma subsp. patula]
MSLHIILLPAMAMVKKNAESIFLLSLYLFLSIHVPHATSLSFSYKFSTPGVLAGADLKYMSDSAAAGDRIDLTKASTWSTGRVAHGQPVRLWDDSTGKVASFTSNFTFAIKPLNSTNQGDGMAFFVGPYPPSLPQDARGGFLGLFNNPNNTANAHFPPTVAVEFDAFKNDWDPAGTVNHVGVDVNDIRSAAYAALPDASLNGTMSAWVRYDANASTLSAALRFDHLPELGIYNVSATVDLRKARLPQEAAVGFSAATGDYIERHQILSWSFESTLNGVAVVVDRTDNKTSKTKNFGLIMGLAFVGIVILLTLAAWLSHRQYSKRKRTIEGHEAAEDTETPLDASMDSEFEKGTGPRRFSYSELSQATHGFSDDEKLGEGGFGSVYRGFLQDQGLHVAIKRVSKTSSQGRREYISEVTIISRLRHRNLVQLVGWCHDADELLLVYELMTNGSLDTHLHSSRNTLSWPIRYKIILGMGSALVYLHQEWEQCVVHRDIKPSNVMLDSSFNAKLGDFGLARLIDHSRGAHTTMLAGTMGYMDPECAVTSRASAETDVYSFGIVLLEIACGQKPIVQQAEDESTVRLVHWVWALHGRGKLLDAADARLRDGEFDAGEMERALVVGLWCVHPDYELRPSIRQAVNVLQFEAPLPEIPPEMPVPTYYMPPPPAAGGRGSSDVSNGEQSSRSHRTARSSGSSAVSGSQGRRDTSETRVASALNQAMDGSESDTRTIGGRSAMTEHSRSTFFSL